MVSWPDLTFPPLNLWNFPRQPNLYKEKKMMQISLYDTNGSYTISLDNDFETLDEYVELLIKPVLRAAGFQEASLDKYFVEEEPLSFPDWELEPIEKKVVDKVAKKYWE